MSCPFEQITVEARGYVIRKRHPYVQSSIRMQPRDAGNIRKELICSCQHGVTLAFVALLQARHVLSISSGLQHTGHDILTKMSGPEILVALEIKYRFDQLLWQHADSDPQTWRKAL